MGEKPWKAIGGGAEERKRCNPRQGKEGERVGLFYLLKWYDTIWYDFWNEMTEQNDEQRAKETEKAC